jgi:citrate synthase
MNAFWRNNNLTESESELFKQLLLTHHKSCFRDNASSMAVVLAADASGSLSKAIAAGIATMGGKHAPVEETTWFLSLENPAREVDSILKRGGKVPGWGGTYQKGKPDPLWDQVDTLIKTDSPVLYSKLLAVTNQFIIQHNKSLYPNPSAYTACVAIALGMPPKLTPYLFISGRITGWAELAAGHLGV